MPDQLALFGGQPVISQPFTPFKTLGQEEAEAASQVVKEGVLSAYIAAPGEFFMGGHRVKAFEQQAAEYFGVKHAIAVNSWTSGLIAAVGALGLEPGDEIITTPWTMCATATAILHFNHIPVFADIDPVTFNICPKSVEERITPRTRAILAADIFGQSADIFALRQLCDRYNLKLISDTAQAPGAMYHGHYAGTLADIGGYSFNYHKHIHCGEGGLLVTNDDQLAERLCLLRNHAESSVQGHFPQTLNNMLGFNFRMGEIEAAIAAIQLTRLEERVASRQQVAEQLTQGLAGLKGVSLPKLLPASTHAYYVYGITLDLDEIGVSRKRLVEALRAEGVSVSEGYQNIHLLPLFRNKIAYGTQGFPWTAEFTDFKGDYAPGLCPTAENLHQKTFIGLGTCLYEYTNNEINLVIQAFRKVWNNTEQLVN